MLEAGRGCCSHNYVDKRRKPPLAANSQSKALIFTACITLNGVQRNSGTGCSIPMVELTAKARRADHATHECTMDRQDLINVELGFDSLGITSHRTDRSELDVPFRTSMTTDSVKRESAMSNPSEHSEQQKASSGNNSITTTSSIITNTSGSRRRKPQRTVSFATKATASIIASLDDISEEEKEALWRTAQDRKDEELSIVQTVKAYRKAATKKSGSKKHEVPQDMTSRGIEHLIDPENRERLRQRRDRMVDAVLDLQDDYWKRGAHLAEPVALRTVSMKHTAADVEEAIKKAASDEAYVRRLRRFEGFHGLSSQSYLELSKKIASKK